MTLFAVALYAEIRGGKEVFDLQLFHCGSEEQAKQEMREYVFRDLYRQGVDEDQVHSIRTTATFITAGDLAG